MFRAVSRAMVFGLLGFAVSMPTTRAAAPEELDRYNVVWDAPSHNASGSMPLGNGEVGVNLWVEESGDLLFYVARTDAWSEACRLLKLGRVRLSLSPNPFAKGAPFRQELKLRDGRAEITAGPKGAEVTLSIFVEADRPVIRIAGTSAAPVSVRAAVETWRTQRRRLAGDELESSWTMFQAPDDVEVWESADVVPDHVSGAAVCYHRNESSVVPFTLKRQGLEPFRGLLPDPLRDRTFGLWLSGPELVQEGPTAMKTAQPATTFEVSVVALSAQMDAAEEWFAQAEKIAAGAPTAAAAEAATAEWWAAFWDRSWILAETGKDAPAEITRGYLLQRYMAACAGRGNYPIKFNGSLFTVEPRFTDARGGLREFNADWRRWGDCYWWQNTRLPYQPMPAQGDLDQMLPLFRFYKAMTPLCEARAKLYFGAQGVYYPETMTCFGTYANKDYGWDRQGLKISEIANPYWRYAWQQGLELVGLMQDYYDYTQDAAFLRDELAPMAHQVLAYYDARFPRDAAGKLVISPTQSAETYWYDVVNDTPSIAGLIGVLDRLLALPADSVPAAERAYWEKMRTATPPLPLAADTHKGQEKHYILPAEKYRDKRDNVENPELYAVTPFRLFGLGKPGLETAVETFDRRIARELSGWSYDGQAAALLGLVDESQRLLTAKASNSNPKHRFPAMWGPNHDWLPDQDHGSNLMMMLQYMLLQADGDRLLVLPAWPKSWDVHFKLHAPRRTTVECDYRDGKIVKLEIVPAQRRKDAQVMLPGAK